MDIDEVLEIDPTDPDQRLAEELVHEDDQLLADLVRIRRDTMTQQEVADRLGISRPAVAAFERYDADPRLSTVRRYALAVRAHVEHIVTPDAERQAPEISLLWTHLTATCDLQAQEFRTPLLRWLRLPHVFAAHGDVLADAAENDFPTLVFRDHEVLRGKVGRMEASAEA